MIRPPWGDCALNAATAACVMRSAPRTLTAITRSNSAIGSSSIGGLPESVPAF